MSNGLFAVVVVVALILLHLQQVSMLSGSVSEYWKRTDRLARTSKLLFVVSLSSCAFILLWPILGVFGAVALMVASLGTSMNEWKR